MLNSRTRHLITTLTEYRWLLILPTIAGFVLALFYVALIRSESWTSRQRLMIRDDLLGQPQKPGQFNSLEAMRSRQETILEVARSPEVISSVLKQLGPQRRGLFFNAEHYPDMRTIESYQRKIALTAPNGGELGKTETVTLLVKESSSDRSHTFISLLLDEIEHGTQHVRSSVLRSMEQEITLARDAAQEALNRSIVQLRQMEGELGLDTVVMANMSSVMTGENSLRQEVVQLENEKRNYEAQLEMLSSVQQTLALAESNPELVVSSSAPFLRDQQKLSQVARSLVDAQRDHADVASRYQDIHPAVANAAERLDVMREHLVKELIGLTVALRSQVKETEQQVTRLNAEIKNRTERLELLSSRRGDHVVINAELAKRAEKLNEYDTVLQSIQSFREQGGIGVWLSRVGAPQTASAPDGLSKRSSVMAGGFLGFMFGLGLVMLLAPDWNPDSAESSGILVQTKQTRASPVEVNRQPHSQPGPPKGEAVLHPIKSHKQDRQSAGSQTADLQRDQFTQLDSPDTPHASGEPLKEEAYYEDKQSQQLERLEKLLKFKKNNRTDWPADLTTPEKRDVPFQQSSGQPEHRAESTEKVIVTSPTSAPSSHDDASSPVHDLLNQFRSDRDKQTDPLAHLTVRAVEAKVPNLQIIQRVAVVQDTPVVQMGNLSLTEQVAEVQQSTGLEIDVLNNIRQVIDSASDNLFLKESSSASQNAAANSTQQQRQTPSQTAGSIPV